MIGLFYWRLGRPAHRGNLRVDRGHLRYGDRL